MGWVQSERVSNNRVESLSYLSEISNVKQIESLKQLALLHDEYLWAGVQKCPDVLQAEKLNRNKGIFHIKEEYILILILIWKGHLCSQHLMIYFKIMINLI